MKQHLGLNASLSTHPPTSERWIWLCALAYWQLLLMRHQVEDLRPAWHPHARAGRALPLTPGQVQRTAQRFLLKMGSPAPATRPAGKGLGRPWGYHPKRRQRYPVVKKGKKQPNMSMARAPAAV